MADLDSLFLEAVPLIDVRSPGEFQSGSVPGATNLPILNDEERAEIGTVYKKKGQAAAIALGHERVSGKIRGERIAAWIRLLQVRPGARVYCARGGLRSEIACEWIRQAGVPVQKIPGGYKALRNHLLERMNHRSENLRFRVIGGKTGSGKTRFLQECGLPFIDLEALACHKGSSFGSMGPQPAQATFENALSIELLRHPPGSGVLLEDESVMIGALSVPRVLHQRMKTAPLFILETELSERVRNIAHDYIAPRITEASDAGAARDFFLQGLKRIERKLGGQRTSEIEKEMLQAFAPAATERLENHYRWIEKLLAYYYDPYYEAGIERSASRIAGRGTQMELASRLRLS